MGRKFTGQESHRAGKPTERKSTGQKIHRAGNPPGRKAIGQEIRRAVVRKPCESQDSFPVSRLKRYTRSERRSQGSTSLSLISFTMRQSAS